MNNPPTYEELLTRNNQLARLIVGMTDRLEGSKLELLATGYRMGIHECAGLFETPEAYMAALDRNPYTQQRKKERGL